MSFSPFINIYTFGFIYIKEKIIKNLNNDNFINFKEIVTFENNINLNQKEFDEFREINCNNKLL